MGLRFTVVLLATLGLATGCGGGEDDAGGQGKPAATPAAAAGKLDEDALLTVHDNLVTCAQQHDELGLVAHLSGEEAISDSEGAGGGEYDDHLAAPKATVALTGAGAQYVGLRADTRHRSGTSDVDVLIFPSEDAAAKGREQLAAEAGGKAEQAGVFVNVTLRAAKGAEADALAGCEEEARP
jgi:hypothetical protein